MATLILRSLYPRVNRAKFKTYRGSIVGLRLDQVVKDAPGHHIRIRFLREGASAARLRIL